MLQPLKKPPQGGHYLLKLNDKSKILNLSNYIRSLYMGKNHHPKN